MKDENTCVLQVQEAGSQWGGGRQLLLQPPLRWAGPWLLRKDSAAPTLGPNRPIWAQDHLVHCDAPVGKRALSKLLTNLLEKPGTCILHCHSIQT